MSKSIAIIGCSYSAYEMNGAYKDSWSYQLSQKYPQHTYINYAQGGRGPDYFRWAILDAKSRGVDCVFLSTTFDGRYGYLIDEARSPNRFIFSTQEISSNYTTAEIHNENEIWVSAGQLKSRQNKLGQEILNSSADDILIDYNLEWYEHASQLYNFEKFFTLDFRPWPPYFCQHNKQGVWDMLVDNFDVQDKTSLWTKGVCLSIIDDHWTKLGHTYVLNNYVLNDDVKNYLTQS